MCDDAFRRFHRAVAGQQSSSCLLAWPQRNAAIGASQVQTPRCGASAQLSGCLHDLQLQELHQSVSAAYMPGTAPQLALLPHTPWLARALLLPMYTKMCCIVQPPALQSPKLNMIGTVKVSHVDIWSQVHPRQAAGCKLSCALHGMQRVLHDSAADIHSSQPACGRTAASC